MSEEGGYGWREGAARSVGTFVWPTRAHRVYAVALTVLGAALCFVPLFDRIGYESAAAVGVVAGLFAPYLTLRAIDSGTVPGPL
ncbi:MAG: hypothetical protein ABEL76_00085, partial [Bradymonadaceae bacterium]